MNNIRDMDANFDANLESMKLQLKSLHDNVNIQINEKSKEHHDNLNKYILAITKDIRASSLNREELFRSFAWCIAESVSENKYQLLKLQLEMVETSEKTVDTIETLKSLVQVVSDNSVSVDKYVRLEKLVIKLNENSVTQDIVNESIKGQLQSETCELNKLTKQLLQLEMKNKELQCFVDEMAKVSDPDLTQEYKTHLILIEAMQKEIDKQKKTVHEKIGHMDAKLTEEIVRIISDIVDK